MPTVTQLLAKVGIDLSDVLPGIAAAQTTIGGGISQAAQQAQTGLDGLERSFNVLSATEAKAERDAISLAQAQARLAAAQGDRAGGAATLRSALEQSVGLDERLTAQVQTQIVSLENARSSWQQFGEAASQNLLAVVGPAALLTTGIVALERTGQSFIDAFKFKTTLDENVRSIEVQLQGIRDSGQAFAQAQHYADEYKLTQQQVEEAMLSSVPVMRNTSESLEVILGVFDRLQMRQPGKTFQDAARAIGELQAGQIESIHKVFNVSADEANRMKKEIEGGADAIQVVSEYLDRTGLGMDALKAKTMGASGAMRDLQKAQEDFTLAQAQWAQGPGMAALTIETDAIRGLTRLMTGDLAPAWQSVTAAVGGTQAMQTNALATFVATRDVTQAQNAGLIGLITTYGRLVGLFPQVTEATQDTTQATVQATAAQRDRVDISKLDEAALQRLHDTLQTTGQRASEAWGRLNDAQRQYEQDGQTRLADHQQRLADIQQAGAERLAQIDSRYQEQRASADETYSTRIADIRRGLNQRLADMEREYTEGEAEKQQAGAERLMQIDANLARQIEEQRRNSGQRLTEIAQEIQQHQEDSARQAAERLQAYQERQAEQQQQLAQRLADLEQQQLDRRAEAQQAYQDRVAELHQRAAELEQQALEAEEQRQRDYAERIADIRAQAAQRAADQAQQAAERAADDAQRWQDAEADRAQQHADRIEELRRRLEGGGAATFGRTTTLTGQTFTTQMTGGDTGDRARIEAEIAAEEARYQREEQRAAQAEARRREREARDLARQAEQAARAEQQAERQAAEQLAREERQAAERLAQQEAGLVQQQGALDQSYAQQEQRAQQAAERQRQILEQQFAAQQAAAERQRARQEQQAAEQDAREIAHLQQQIARERAAETQREADARQTADRQRADLEAQLARDAASRARHYEEQRTKATEAAGEQMADAQRTYVRQLTDLAKAHDQQRAEQERALREQIAKEADSYARQEEQRAAAFAKQKTQLEQAMGEQVEAYTKAQKDLGLITKTEADRRDRIVEDSYLHQAQAQRAAFDQFFSGLTGPSGGDVAPSWVYNGGASGPNAPTNIANLNIAPGAIVVQGASDPQAAAVEVRTQLIRMIRANGGSVSEFFGGTP